LKNEVEEIKSEINKIGADGHEVDPGVFDRLLELGKKVLDTPWASSVWTEISSVPGLTMQQLGEIAGFYVDYDLLRSIIKKIAHLHTQTAPHVAEGDQLFHELLFGVALQASRLSDPHAITQCLLTHVDLELLTLEQLCILAHGTCESRESELGRDTVFQKDVFLTIIKAFSNFDEERLARIVQDDSSRYVLRLAAVASGRVTVDVAASVFNAKDFVIVLDNLLLVGPKTYEFLVRLAKHYDDDEVYAELAKELTWAELDIGAGIDLCVLAGEEVFWETFCSKLNVDLVIGSHVLRFFADAPGTIFSFFTTRIKMDIHGL